MILPDDEMTIQRMLGVSEIPADVHDEYLDRVRFLHREVSGGPLGPGMVVDMLRHLGYSPGDSGSTQGGVKDWRSVDRGTRVQVRRAGHWTAADMECRFEGFVDSGTLAVLLPGGRVDEFNKCDVRLLEEESDGVIRPDESVGGTMRDGSADPDARLDLYEKDAKESPSDEAEGSQSSDQDSESEGPSDAPAGKLNEDGELVELNEPVQSWPRPSWRSLKKGDDLWVRERVGDEVDVHDAKFVKKIPKNVKVLMVVDGEEVERTFPDTDVRTPDA